MEGAAGMKYMPGWKFLSQKTIHYRVGFWHPVDQVQTPSMPQPQKVRLI
jgi:hypothetical protein